MGPVLIAIDRLRYRQRKDQKCGAASYDHVVGHQLFQVDPTGGAIQR